MADEENLENLTEELGDVLDNLFILADKYDISLEMIMQKHRTKLMERYPEERRKNKKAKITWSFLFYVLN